MLTVAEEIDLTVPCLTQELGFSQAQFGRFIWTALAPTVPISDSSERQVTPACSGILREGTLTQLNERECYHQSLNGRLFRESVVDTDISPHYVCNFADATFNRSVEAAPLLVPGSGVHFSAQWPDGNFTCSGSYDGEWFQLDINEPGYPPVYAYHYAWSNTTRYGSTTIEYYQTYVINRSGRLIQNSQYSYSRAKSQAENETAAILAATTSWARKQAKNNLWCDTLVGPCPAEAARIKRGGITDSEVTELRDYYAQLTGKNFPFTHHLEKLGMVCQAAIENAQYISINSIAYLKDLPALLAEVKAVKQLIANPRKPKNWAGAYLSFQYGTRLTVADTQELLEGVKAWATMPSWRKHSTCRARKTWTLEPLYDDLPSVNEVINYKVYYEPYDHRLARFMKTCYDWDLWLSLENTWDLIPLSFIVNWFADIESALQSMDAIAYSEYLSVLGVTRSRKLTVDITDWQNGHSRGIRATNLSFERYNRIVQDGLDLPVPGAFMETMTFPNHLAELTAIVVQRGR